MPWHGSEKFWLWWLSTAWHARLGEICRAWGSVQKERSRVDEIWKLPRGWRACQETNRRRDQRDLARDKHGFVQMNMHATVGIA